MSNDLVTWLRAQLDEDEAKHRHVLAGDSWESLAGSESESRRVLREVEAKRRIIELYGVLNEPALYEAIQALALPHADRPGYREEWRP